MNGSVTGEKTTYPNEIILSCDEGFITAGSEVRKCLSTGIWSGNQTSCTGNSLMRKFEIRTLYLLMHIHLSSLLILLFPILLV